MAPHKEDQPHVILVLRGRREVAELHGADVKERLARIESHGEIEVEVERDHLGRVVTHRARQEVGRVIKVED